jgi:hypothetical protein
MFTARVFRGKYSLCTLYIKREGSGAIDEPRMQEESMSIWASGVPYEAYAGRWSRLGAREFLPWLAVPGGSQ